MLGSGSWGTALSVLLARNDVAVELWGRAEDEIDTLIQYKENLRYLPGVKLPDLVTPTSEFPTTADFWLIAVPSGAVREVVCSLPNTEINLVMASKGLEFETSKRMSEIVHDERPKAQVCALSGPNLAVEIAKGIPTASVIASKNLEIADWIRGRLMCRSFRTYTSLDVVGVEMGGALKNVLAIGAGMSDGLGFGDNTKGALLARGLREMATLGSEFGAEYATFMGLSGVGDLFATAVSKLSRNYRLGKMLAEGHTLDNALNEIGQVAEGVHSSHAAVQLARKVNVETPLMEGINKVLTGQTKPLEAVSELMERSPRIEI